MTTSVKVIGGGPAGLRVAKLLSGEGFDVTLYEAGRIGNGIQCGEAYLDVYPVERPKHGLLFEHEEVRHITSGEKVIMDGSHMYQYDKGEMLRGMRDEAIDAGAEVMEDETVSSVGGKVLTVDASGFPSIAFSRADYETAFAVSHIVEKEVEGMLFDWDGNNGYYWKFPKRGESNVGYGSFIGFEGVWGKSKKFAKSVGSIKNSGGGYIPIDFRKNLWLPEKRAILVGDAAGLANEFHGGGIHSALLSAEIAAECIAEGNPQSYEARLKRSMEAEDESAEMANEFLAMGCLNSLLRTGGTIRDFTNPGLLRKVAVGVKYLGKRLTRKFIT